MNSAGELQLIPRQPSRRLTEAEIICELKETVSASRLYTWLRCRLQFYFKYVRRVNKAPTPGLFVGNVIHGVLQQ
ncbi:MAG: hypothetical protein JWM68_695 [Verrucomicrobiales bacterium]|nr:hypothetical protein [Verrucomicrobiales bacterium]